MDDLLFININGQPLKRNSCQQALIYYIKKQRGVEITSIHAFRRTYATMYVESGGNLFALQQLMGHSKLEITRKYVNLSIKQLQQNYSKYNPLEVMLNKNKKQKMKMKK